MIDVVWIGLIVSVLIGIWVLVCLLAHLCATARELLYFLKHKELLQHHASASTFEREMRGRMRREPPHEP